MYVDDTYNSRIRKVTIATKEVTTLAGGLVVDGSTAGWVDASGTGAQFNGPTGLALDVDGNVYVADRSNNRIRKVTTGGDVSTLAGSGTRGFGDGASAQFNRPAGLAVAGGTVYVADADNNRIRKVTTAGW